MPGLQAELAPEEGSAHLVASIPQVLQGQPLALSMEETDQSLQQGRKRGSSEGWPMRETCGFRKHGVFRGKTKPLLKSEVPQTRPGGLGNASKRRPDNWENRPS